MFYYLSFLRPLPNVSGTQGTVSITPQIANDLRTSHLEDTLDIFYTWCPSLADLTSPSTISTMKKLTAWRTSTIYKNIPLNFPPIARSGQVWRLALSCTNNPRGNPDFVINLASEDFGKQPLPVISMPVRLEPSNKSINTSKQEQIERLYSLPLKPDDEQGVILCIREQTSFELDKKIWDSGLALSSWFAKLIRSSKSSGSPFTRTLDAILTSSQPTLQIVELGSGSGIVSICLSALIDRLRPSLETLVWATDLPSAMELIEHNISTNQKAYTQVNLRPLIFDWDDDTVPPSISNKIDLIVMADVTYNTASFPSLVKTLDQLIKGSSGGTSPDSPVVLLAYKQRDPAERELWDMLKSVGVNLSLVDRVLGAGVEPVEIWMSDVLCQPMAS